MTDFEQMVKRQRALADFGDFALRSENLDEVLTEACRLVGEALGTERAKILELERDGRSLLVRAGVGWDLGVVGELRLPMGERSSGAFSIRAGVPVISPDINEEDRFEVPASMKAAGVAALANVPVFLPGGRAYGLLEVDSTEPRGFGEEDTGFLRTYAAILGPVIDRLHKAGRLRAAEERFRLVVENARDYAIFVTDPESRITDWFPGAEAVFGWTAAEAVGRSGSILFTPEDRARHEDAKEIETARAEGAAPDRRWHLRKDGARVFIDGSTTALRGADGGVRGFLKIGQDVTERRRTEERLRASERRLRRAIETDTVGVVFFENAGAAVEANEAFLRMTGYARADIASGALTWRRMTPPEWMAASEERIEELAATGRFGPYEKECLLKDGSRRWMLFAGRDLGDGTAVEFCIDTTDRKRAEAALRESEARFRHMADSAPALIWMTDAEGRVVFANMHFGHVFGRPAGEMHGDGWRRVVHPDDLAGFEADFRAAFEARRPLRAEVRVRDKEGAARWMRCEGVPRLDDAGAFLGYTGCAVDVTDARLAADALEDRVRARTAELMAAEETLRQAQKMEAVGQLTGGIAHDFNNMLQGVAGGLEMARRRVAEGRAGEAGRYLDAARGAVDRAAGLTRRLLAFARRQRLDPKPVDADALVAGMADLIRRAVGPGVGLELRLRDGTGSVVCDANELESALLNLCINARDAMPGGGRLLVGTEEVRLSAADIPDGEAPPGCYVAVSVSDTGTGMPPEVIERVFEPFFTTKPQGQGTGLGLSQVYGFVKQSGGLVRIESAPGRGTTVRLLLPLHERMGAAEAAAAAAPPRPGGRGTVLLVDDEGAARGPLADRLRELGCAVLEARDGPEALRVLEAARPDLLVTDVGLPNGMNGRQVAEAARERIPGLPVLFITGYAGTPLPAGVEVVGKPFELDALARRVQAMLHGGTREGTGTTAPRPSGGQASPDGP
ncbi:PAS domain-containing protein [Craurococcus roseus]|uniref:histidine kinase n=1 Tax=Craurococcus roseus TaxID=77585 RepID=A0ABP3R9Y2_9PROT